MAVLIGRYSLLMTLSIAHAVITDTFSDGTLVQLKEGKIRGHFLKSENGKDYYAFQEIPYAAPPVGKNRFQLPKKVEKWQGVLNTTKNTKICYQAVSRFGLEISEDCLFVNVYTPLKPGSKSKKLPVLLWIHGGGLSSESSTYEYSGPKYIMDHEIIVVTFNYRLGPFGFTTTEDDIIPANIGLKDQKFAIKWVNENIHLFGGDPAKVTLVGESSGSLSVSLHVLAQKNGGEELFRGAIMESGSPLVGFEQKNPREEAFNCGRTLDRNFRSNDTGDLLKVLQEAPAASILKECTKASGSIIEKEGDFSYAPFQTLLEGNFGKVPILLGFNSEEFIWACIDPDEDTVIALDEDPGRLVPTGINISPENKTIAGKLLKEVYTNTSFENDIGGYCRWNSDSMMNIHMLKHAELIAPQVPTYLYVFSYFGELGQSPSEIIPGAGRVAHAAELHYMWDDGSNSDLSKFPEEDRLTLHRFVKLWTNFVKYQNPTPSHDPLLNGFIWPTTDSENLRYFNFNDTLEVKENPRQFKEVRSVLDRYLEPPYIYY